MKLLRYLTTKNIHVMPLDNKFFADQYAAMEFTPLQLFVNNWRRYSWRVAVHNFLWFLREMDKE